MNDEALQKSPENVELANQFTVQRMPCPQQDNGYDCGVCVVMNADYICDDLPLQQCPHELFPQQNCDWYIKG